MRDRRRNPEIRFAGDLARLAVLSQLALVVTTGAAHAQSAEDIAKALQDPLGNIKALMIDNSFNLNAGSPDERTGYNFQVQPVYALPSENFVFIPRAVVPIVGAPTGAKFPNLGPPVGGTDDVTWGLSDIMLQTFFSPRSEGRWKWGIGPQVSFKSRTDEAVAGPGWGAGVSAVLVGALEGVVGSAWAGRQQVVRARRRHWLRRFDRLLLHGQPTRRRTVRTS